MIDIPSWTNTPAVTGKSTEERWLVTILGAMYVGDDVILGADAKQASLDDHSGFAFTSWHVDKLAPIFDGRVVWGYYGMGSKGYAMQRVIENAGQPTTWNELRASYSSEFKNINGASPNTGALFAGFLGEKRRILVINEWGTAQFLQPYGYCGYGRVAAEVGLEVANVTRPHADPVNNFRVALEMTVKTVDDLDGPLSLWRVPADGAAFKIL